MQGKPPGLPWSGGPNQSSGWTGGRKSLGSVRLGSRITCHPHDSKPFFTWQWCGRAPVRFQFGVLLLKPIMRVGGRDGHGTKPNSHPWVDQPLSSQVAAGRRAPGIIGPVRELLPGLRGGNHRKMLSLFEKGHRGELVRVRQNLPQLLPLQSACSASRIKTMLTRIGHGSAAYVHNSRL